MKTRPDERAACASLLATGLVALAVLASAGCRAPAHPSLPAGPGLVTSDRTPPPGSETFEAPEWQVGDRFVYRKAGLARLSLRVVAGEDGHLQLLDEDDGRLLYLGPEGLERGQATAEGERDFELDPGDQLLCWPLWQGKRWTAQFVSRGPGRGDLPLIATYLCDGRETVTVPAGSYDCLRIWRRARVAAEGDFAERVTLLWYAPEVGIFARRLDDGLVSELVEVQRQR